ncbi:Peptidase family M50 [Acididesulfobacillus acetoxydans]|uniref:Zinc metalloprotease n=1 Tax=Acididesulfobacillus acetoxydans TaxID=1561005 RepID=A0A8S0XCK0_9FIRM|nr:RIP metalloprotease RseP [Acididesulfobacillus acetoxydans]CAA7602546.1 Peptidase family M50 [Acididesulfobacillus acetoxydans]CEJ07308.1 Zinc metalloprotease RasP [Acididesulfobacillus acetoxydans]
MVTALAVIFVFGSMVMIHEFGHFMIARMTGIKVLEFSFGFGPKLLWHQGKETLYAWRLIPLGGFVRLYGMDPEPDETGEPQIAPADDKRSFMNKRVWQRMAVIAAGPIMNFVLAMLLFVGVFAYLGLPAQAQGNAVGSLVQGKAAEKAGIVPGDRIVAVDGEATPDWNRLTDVIHALPNQNLLITLERGGKTRTIKVRTEKDPQTGYGLIGIAPEIVYRRLSIFQAVGLGWERTVEFTKFILVAIVEMITGKIPAQVGGPVAIAQAIGQGAKEGLANLLGLTGVLSIQLGLLNLFPIPALDGSRLVFLAVEGLRGKPLNPERENLIHFVGFVLLVLVMLAVTYHDILQLFVKGG